MTRAISRRQILRAGAGLAVAAVLPAGRSPAAATQAKVRTRLVAAPGRVRIVPEPWPETGVWCYGGSVPGPVLRVPQGGRIEVEFENRLPQPTTIHWHGVRLPNAMDGVPGLTQEPVPPGGRFRYAFDVPDAGTYWYHPHLRTSEQLERGLAGVLIVDEAEPPPVDRDLLWVIDDWLLDHDAAVAGGFDDPHDAAHAGRLGNTATLNGRVAEEFPVRSGERLRLRLVNVANARIFALDFGALRPRILALDGQPVEPHPPEGGTVVLGPGMRADLVLDVPETTGGRFPVLDRADPGEPFRFVDVVGQQGGGVRAAGDIRPLPPNPVPEPDLAEPVHRRVLLVGGAMGGMMVRRMGIEPGRLEGEGIWFVDGVASPGEVPARPFLTLQRGRSCVLELVNATAFAHPMHLHGHVFRVLSRNGEPLARRMLADTLLLAPGERAEIAFLADNPGDWLFHCHIPEHMAAGMTALLRVT